MSPFGLRPPRKSPQAPLAANLNWREVLAQPAGHPGGLSVYFGCFTFVAGLALAASVRDAASRVTRSVRSFAKCSRAVPSASLYSAMALVLSSFCAARQSFASSGVFAMCLPHKVAGRGALTPTCWVPLANNLLDKPYPPVRLSHWTQLHALPERSGGHRAPFPAPFDVLPQWRQRRPVVPRPRHRRTWAGCSGSGCGKVRGSIALDGYESRPQAIFLKADPRAGRPDIPTVPQPHLTASIEGHNSAGRLPAGALFSQNLQHGKPLSSRRWSIKFPCVRHRLISELRPRTETAPPHGNGRRVWNGDSAQPVHRLFAHHAKGRWLCHAPPIGKWREQKYGRACRGRDRAARIDGAHRSAGVNEPLASNGQHGARRDFIPHRQSLSWGGPVRSMRPRMGPSRYARKNPREF
jgi:hypothetical protein